MQERLGNAALGRGVEVLEDFDFQFNPQVPKSRVIDLAACGFVSQRRNVLLLGPSGVGKSHIAQALGQRACRLGFKVLYVTARDMFRELRAARGDGTHDRKLLKFTEPSLLILDDLGLRSLVPQETLDLNDVVRLRYERGSLVVTSNRALDELPGIFGDPLLSSAAMDRLLDDAHVLGLEGSSYRNPPPEKRKARRKRRRNKGGDEVSKHGQRSDPFGRPERIMAIAFTGAVWIVICTGSVWPPRARSVPAP